MIKPTFKYEEELIGQGYDFVVGIDEAGRGPLAGPVVACAVSLKNGDSVSIMETESLLGYKIRDSKLLSEKQREELFDFIHEHFYVGVGICDHETIDRVNILEATYLAMKKAVGSVTRSVEREAGIVNKKNVTRYALRATRTIILVDGNKIIPNLSLEQKSIVNGDKIVKSISAASIVAKVTRDRIMREMHEKYPQYCFNKHKGYGTRLHMEMIEKYGICPIHRVSFEPCNGRRKK